jgi:glycosyltransferase involved in cell wall biosynthesis
MTKQAKNPKVSVIIPTYNRGWILREAIDSVLAQDHRDYELIVVDDGSTDDTRQILGSYGRDIVVLQQPNRGVSGARNRGIAESRAPLVAFLDSDDLWLPQKLTRQVAFFQSKPDALICQTEETWLRNGARVNPKKRHRKPAGQIFEPSLALCLVSPSAVMIRKPLFDAVGLFDERLPACEDYDLWLRISCRHPVFLIDEPLIIKRGGHADQLSQAAGLDKYRIQSLKKLIDGEMLTATQRGAAVQTLKEKCAIFANGCRKRGREAEAQYYEKLDGRYQVTELSKSECGSRKKGRGQMTEDGGQKTENR